MPRAVLLAGGGLLASALVVLVTRWAGGSAGLPEWLFGSVVLASLGLTADVVASARRRAAQARRRASHLAAARPDDVARDAVREERRRLDADTAAQLRRLLVAAAHEADAGGDPAATARRVQVLAREAAAELRVRLGLLRPDAGPAEPTRPDGVAPGEARTATSRGDLTLAAGAVGLATVEAVLYPRGEGLRVDPVAVLVAVTAAATVLGRNRRPVPALLATAALLLGGATTDHPATTGFWCLATIGPLAWAVGLRRPRPTTLLALGVAVGGIAASQLFSVPENAAAMAGTAVLGAAGGMLTGVERRRRTRAETSAAARAADLDLVRSAAVDAERRAYAREVHDVVSHAVGVIAVQAAAAEVSAATRPEDAGRALDLVAVVASEALADLDRLLPGHLSPREGASDLFALTERIRSAGTAVTLEVRGSVPDVLAPVVHRVVQESLTNVVRHAPGAAAEVVVTVGDAEVVVRVGDDGPGPGSGPGTRGFGARGFGLVGLGERVVAVGGRLSTARGPSGGFVVEVRLPVAGAGRPVSGVPG